MILGTGIDLIEIGRIVNLMSSQFADRFKQRILTSLEQSQCAGRSRPEICIATHFAVKEAVAKAFGTGIGGALGWRDIELIRKSSGKPEIVIHPTMKQIFPDVRHIHITISHERQHVVAMAVLVN